MLLSWFPHTALVCGWFSLRDQVPAGLLFSPHGTNSAVLRRWSSHRHLSFLFAYGSSFINTRQKKKTCTGKVQIKICYMRLLHRDFPTAAPTGKTGALQEEVYKASAFRSDCPRYVPMLISARFTWILPTRLPVPIGAWSSRLPPRHEVKVKQVLWNKSSAFISGADNPHERFLITSHPHMSWQVPYPVSSRGRSIQLSPQLRREEHIVMPLHWYPKVRNAKCSWQQKIFEIIFLHRKKHPTFSVEWLCIMFNWISRKVLFTMICFENNQILGLNSTLHQKPVRRTLQSLVLL